MDSGSGLLRRSSSQRRVRGVESVMKKFIVFLLVLFVVLSFSADAAELYVSTKGKDTNSGSKYKPFASVIAARNAIRVMKEDGLDEDVTVWIKGGTYALDRTIIFGLKDSAPKGHAITYAAYRGGEPIFTSGKKITGWRKLNKLHAALPDAAQGNVWVADVPGNWHFRTLYDGEKMLPRARCDGFLPTDKMTIRDLRWTDLDTIRFPKGALKNWSNLEDVEIFIRPNHVWIVNYLTLASVNEKTGVAKTTVPATYNMHQIGHGTKAPSSWVENVLEALDEPGEWVLNTQQGKLYLWPTKGSPGKNITAPRLRELVKVEGKNVYAVDGDIPVTGINFRGLTFTCGDRDVWTNEDKGLQHDWEMWDKDNALMRFRGAQDCSVGNCEFRNSGGTGIRLDRYAKNIRIVGNNIHDIGGTGVLLAGYGPGIKDVNKYNLVQNNNIETCSQLYWHNPGVFVWQSGENKILNNRIHNLPYDAVVLSGVRPRFFNITDPVKWVKKDLIPKDVREHMQVIRWDECGSPQSAKEARQYAHARNNLVQDNEINDIMQTLGDGNAIYFSCAAEGNIVRRNLVYNNPRAKQQIRFDDDQEESTVDDNIVIGNGIALKHNNYILNNVIIDGEIVFKKETEPGSKVERNIVYRRKDDAVFYGKSGSSNDVYRKGNADYNIFYCLNEEKGRAFLKEVRDEYGAEKHGIFADPMFVDLDNYDVRLKPGSPALKLGVKSIDIDKIGLLDDPAFKRIRKNGLVSTGDGNFLGEEELKVQH